jgi:predicted regulator of Ras-like GTPase activity (Roadblock/LC7/MglB family)
MEDRTEMMTRALKELHSNTPDIEASAVISTNGLIVASLLPSDIDRERIAAMGAAMLKVGERAARELERGALDQLLIKGQAGYIILMGAGNETILTTMACEGANLGLIFLDMRRTASAIGGIIG